MPRVKNKNTQSLDFLRQVAPTPEESLEAIKAKSQPQPFTGSVITQPPKAGLDYFMRPETQKALVQPITSGLGAVKGVTKGVEELVGADRSKTLPSDLIDKPIKSLQEFEQEKEAESVPTSSVLPRMLKSGGESMPTMLGALAMGPTAGAGLMGVTSGGREFLEAEKAGATTGEALTSAAVSGGAEALLSRVSLGLWDKFLKKTPVSKGLVSKGLEMLPSYLKTTLAEGAEEAGTEAVQFLGRKISYDKDGKLDMAQVLEAGGTGVLMAVILGGLGAGSQIARSSVQSGNIDADAAVKIANEQGYEGDTVQEVVSDIQSKQSAPDIKQETEAPIYFDVERLNDRTVGDLQGLDYKSYQDMMSKPYQPSVDFDIDKLNDRTIGELQQLDYDAYTELMNQPEIPFRFDVNKLNDMTVEEVSNMTRQDFIDLMNKPEPSFDFDVEKVNDMTVEDFSNLSQQELADVMNTPSQRDRLYALRDKLDGIMTKFDTPVETVEQMPAPETAQMPIEQPEAVSPIIESQKPVKAEISLSEALDPQPVTMAMEMEPETVSLTEKVKTPEEVELEKQRAVEKEAFESDRDMVADALGFQEGRQGKQIESGRLLNALFGQGRFTPKTFASIIAKGNRNSPVYKFLNDALNLEEVELSHNRDLSNIISNKVGQKLTKLVESGAWNRAQDVNGRQLTSGEKVWLKLARRDKDAMRNIKHMGFARKNETAFDKINEEEIDAISLSPEEQVVMDAIIEMHDKSAKMIAPEYEKKNNRAFPVNKDYMHIVPHKLGMTLDGWQKYTDKNVFDDINATHDRSGRAAPMLMQDALMYAMDYINDSAKYVAYVNKLDRFNQVMNSPKVKQAMVQRFGVDKDGTNTVQRRFDEMVQEMQGKRNVQNMSDREANALYSRAVRSILFARATTPLKQFGSYTMAMTEIKPQYLAKAMATKTNLKEMFDNSGRAAIRDQRNMDRDLVKMAGMPKHEFQRAVKKVGEAGLSPIKAMDLFTIGKLWEASKLQIDDTMDFKKKDSEYYDAVREVFHNALDTQPNYTAAQKTEIAGAKGVVPRMASMFKSAADAAYNQLVQGVVEARYQGDYTRLGNATAGYVMSHAFMSAVTAGLRALRGKEPEYFRTMILSMIGGIPGLANIVEGAMGFDLDSPVLERMNEFKNALNTAVDMAQNIQSGEKQYTEEQMQDVFYKILDPAISLSTGIGIDNVRESIELGVNLFGGSKTKASLIAKDILDPYKKTYAQEYYDDITVQLKRGNDKGVQNLLDEADDIGIKTSNIMDNMRGRYTEGEITKEELSDFAKFLKER